MNALRGTGRVNTAVFGIRGKKLPGLWLHTGLCESLPLSSETLQVGQSLVPPG